MAPELFQDEGVHSFASDLWALGCVLYEMATGKPPFVSASLNELVGLILNSETPRVEKFSPEFNDLLAGLLEKDPSKRISWEKVRTHVFWHPYEFPTVTLPPQPHFENYLRAKGLIPQPLSVLNQNGTERPTTPSNNADRPKTPTSTTTLTKKHSFPTAETNSQPQKSHKKEVNLLRLSQNAMKNMIKESQAGYENKENKDINIINDVKLINKDQELNFGDKNEEEDSESSGENIEGAGDENGTDEEISENQNMKLDFNSQSKHAIKTPESLSAKTLPSSNINHRKLKPEVDEMSITPKNGRSHSTLIEDAEKLATSNFLSHQRSNSTIVSTPTNASKKSNVPPLEQLLTHTSDTSVKPITGNKEIEKPYDNTVSKDMLPFKYIHPDEVCKDIDSPHIESHLAEIYNHLGSGSNSILDKMNILSYFETIIQNSTVANRLVNSPFMILLVKLCKLKNPTLRHKLCIIIGELIRHATVIEQELSQLGIPAIMADILKEKSEKVRRKAIAALGEYLFYGATQMDEDSSNSVWEIHTSIVALLNKILKSNEDEIVKFYTCKTVENITAQSIKAGLKFATMEFVVPLLQIYTTTKNENLKVCIVSALSHISRLNTSLIWPIMEKLTLSHMCQCFSDSNSRLQQPLITILNLFLHTSGSKAYALLGDEKALIPSLLSLLDNSSVVVRGKAILSFYLMFKTNLKWMMAISENKFGPLIDKLSRDTYKYVQCCLIHLVDLIAELIPIIQKNIQEELNKIKQKEDPKFEASTSPKEYKNYLSLMPIILGVMNSSLLRNKIINNNFLMTMFNIYDLSELTKNSLNDDFRNVVFIIFESFSSNHKLVINYHEIVLQMLFPSLLTKIVSENADTRFNGLKLITDILIQYLNEDSIYDVTGNKPSTKLINDIISKELLPNIKYILSDQEPMPLYGLKLFSIIIGKNIGFVTKLKQKKMLGLFLEYFNSSHPRLTSNTLKIITRIVECKDVTLDELNSMNFLSKAVNILKHFWANNQEWCYEELLDILHHLLFKIIDVLKSMKIATTTLENTYTPIFISDPKAIPVLKQNAEFLELLEVFISLSNHVELAIADKSLTCLHYLLYIFGSLKKREQLIKVEEASLLLGLLNHQSKQALWRKTAKCLLWLAYIQDYKLQTSVEKKAFFFNVLDKHKNSEDKTLGYCCKELKNCLVY